MRPPTLLKKRLWHRCFTVNFQKFLRTPYLQNTSGWLLLYIVYFELFLLLWSSPLYFSIQGTFAVYQDGLGWRPNIGFLLAKVFAGLWPADVIVLNSGECFILLECSQRKFPKWTLTIHPIFCKFDSRESKTSNWDKLDYFHFSL